MEEEELGRRLRVAREARGLSQQAVAGALGLLGPRPQHAGLEDVRLHDLRHSLASRALALGEGLPMIGDLLGHRMVTTTARYTHLARDSVREATAKIGDDLGARLAPPDGRVARSRQRNFSQAPAMRSPNKLTLSRRAVDALPVAEREIVFWDRDLSGFGVRVHPTGSKVYIVHTRAGGKSRRVTIGRHGVWTPERARREAARLIASLKPARRRAGRARIRRRPPGRRSPRSPSGT